MMEQLLTSSVLILAVLGIRLLLRGRRAARLQYALWLLVALRLLIPGSLSALPWSALSLAEDAGLNQAVEAVRYETRRETVYVPASGSFDDPADRAWLDEAVGGRNRDVQVEAVEKTDSGQVRLDVSVERDRLGILRVLWYAGMGLMAVWFLLSNLRFGLRLRRMAQPTGVRAARPVYAADLPSPCLWGLLRPNIYVTPACLREPRQLRHVLAHEEAHLRHGDQLWSLVRCACLVVWWFNPLVWLAAFLSRRDCELAADETAVQRLGEPERLAYGRTLLDVVAQGTVPGSLLQTATTMHAGVGSLRERIARLASGKPLKAWLLILTLALLAVTAGCVFSGGREAEAAPPAETSETAEPAAEPEPAEEPVEPEASAEPEVWRRYPGEIPAYPDLHVEDSLGNDVSAELIDLWYASSAVYDVDDYQMFQRGESGEYVELLDYDAVVSAIFTEDGRRQLELTHLGGGICFPLIRQENGSVFRKTGWKTGYFYGGALQDMEVLSAEADRLTVLVTYQRDRGIASPDPDPQYDALEWVVVRTDGLWRVESYPYPEDQPEGMLCAAKGTYTDGMGNEWDYSYELPLFRFDGEEAETVNRELRDGLGARIAEEFNSMENGTSLSMNRVSYALAGKDRIVTLVLRAAYVWEFTDYAVYHYDLEQNRFLTNEEMLLRLGEDPETCLQALREAAAQEFLASVPDADMEILGGQEFYDQQYAATLSEENLNRNTMLFFQDGTLYAIVPIYGFAGAEWYYHVIPVNRPA